VPIKVTLRNQLVATNVDFEVAIQQPHTFEVIGVESLRLSLVGGEETTLSMEALIPRPGVYDLQMVRVTVRKDGEAFPYNFSLQQWLITVSEA
jgi:hypothetical protein